MKAKSKRGKRRESEMKEKRKEIANEGKNGGRFKRCENKEKQMR